VVTITVTCYSWAPSSGDYLFSCGAISRPLHNFAVTIPIVVSTSDVVETVTSETETATWLKFRDETETETLS